MGGFFYLFMNVIISNEAVTTDGDQVARTCRLIFVNIINDSMSVYDQTGM